jgi:NAD(P)-dependent dehydrogenase (short-subunit alcohol dehydrogenase family)
MADGKADGDDMMKILKDKVAVITGAASGIGREIAKRCGEEGMKLVLSDVDIGGLNATAAMAKGAESICVECDVTDPGSVDAMASAAYARFGAVHLLFNNAGVIVSGTVWSSTLEDWKWVMDVNLMGVVHGIRSFVPRMRAAGEQAHVVNTASLAGLTTVPGLGAYCVSKHAVVAITECLHLDLRAEDSPIGVSVLCPAFVPTGIAHSERNRPAALAATSLDAASFGERTAKAVQSGKLSATNIANMTIDAVKAGDFYIVTHVKSKAAIETRMVDILGNRIPATMGSIK